jgi:hypothetical protein
MSRARDVSESYFPSGTKMLFQQTSAPTGWTKVTSSNDVALRVVSGTVGSGGSVAFETAFASHTPTITISNASVTLSSTQVPVLRTDTYYNAGTLGAGRATESGPGTSASAPTNNSGGGGHTHSNTGSSSAINLDVSYVDVIIATKD